MNSKMVKLPRIIPVIFYHGARIWKFPLDFSSYFEQCKEMNDYLPDFKADMYNLNSIDDSKIHGSILYQAVIRTLKYAAKDIRPYLGDILESILTLTSNEELKAFLYKLFEYILEVSKDINEKDIEKELKSIESKKTEEVYMTIAEKWRKEAKTEGKLEGEILGKQHILLRLLEKKFSISREYKEKIINTKDRGRLDNAIDHLLDAQSIDEVLEFID